MKINQWNILFFKVFYEQYQALVGDVKELRNADPGGYKFHPKTKLLAAVQKAIKTDVPADPLHRKFMLGKTLGSKYTSWRRVKKGLPQRYRMFFRCYSGRGEKEETEKWKSIIFVWLNDEHTLRKKGGKHDVYTVFRKMLEKGTIPNDYKKLFGESKIAL